MFERYSFVALTTKNLAAARQFWAELLGFPVTEERAGEFFIVDAGGLRLCVDLADGETHIAGSTDPVIGLKVSSIPETLETLAARGLMANAGPISGVRGSYATIRDPDGRAVILTETD